TCPRQLSSLTRPRAGTIRGNRGAHMAIQFELVRPEDLLNLLVRGENLRLNGDDPKYPVLELANSEKPAFLILTFPPQTIAERAYFEAPIVVIGQDPQSGVPPDPD